MRSLCHQAAIVMVAMLMGIRYDRVYIYDSRETKMIVTIGA
ncbi:hypothetical protein [Myroides odoratimimus]|nr:hypothetical protein [Myroides odoratimimus]